MCNGCIDLLAGYFTDELRQAGLPLSLSLVFVTVFVSIIVIAFVLVFVIVFVIVIAMVASNSQLIISQISHLDSRGTSLVSGPWTWSEQLCLPQGY